MKLPSPLFLLNFLLLQWFFIRLAKIEDDEMNIEGWTYIKVWPLTGWWWSDYKYWGRS